MIPWLNYRIPINALEEIGLFAERLAEFKEGRLTDVEFKAIRVPFGIYEQRKRGLFMVRVRLAAGVVLPAQLEVIAALAEQYGSGLLHLTTRQEMQIHDVPLDPLPGVLRALNEAGLSTRGGGGNTVRNITASWDSGIAAEGLFDVTPHAVELTSRLIELPDSWRLPRKYKIAFSHNDADNALATLNDLGFVAVKRDGKRGFRVFVAGGMGLHPEPGHLLHDFIDETEVAAVAEAVKRLFSRLGNRKNKHAARLRFLWRTLGESRFRGEYAAERAILSGEGFVPLSLPEEFQSLGAPEELPAFEGSPKLRAWRDRHVSRQAAGTGAGVRVPIWQGVIRGEALNPLAKFLAPLGHDLIRLTPDQNFALRNIPVSALSSLYEVLGGIAPLRDRPALLGKTLACAGASTCQLGICRSRDALDAVVEEWEGLEHVLDSLKDFDLRLSGCPNTCGQHMAARLGFFGKAVRHNDRAYPAYVIVANADLDGVKGARLAERVDEVPARRLPEFVREYLTHVAERQSAFNGFNAYFEAEGRDRIREICNRLREIPAFSDDPFFYRDFGTEEPFSLEGRGGGECSAGVFDLLATDFRRIQALRASLTAGPATPDALYALALYSSRMLLITRGAEARSNGEVFTLFLTHFVDAKLIDERFRPLILRASRGPAALTGGEDAKPGFFALADAVEALYKDLGVTLQIGGPVAVTKACCKQVTTEKDLRGVACPMNFVKTKMALQPLSKGALLEVLLDDGAPIENVPGSVAAEGHAIVGKSREGGYWRLTIRKEG